MKKKHGFNSIKIYGEPKNCKFYYSSACESCEFINSENGCHPGGSSVHSVEIYYCEIGYWKENF